MLLELGADLAEERSVPPGGDIPVLLLHHLLRGPHGLQVSRDGSLQLWSGLVEGSQPGLGGEVVGGDSFYKYFSPGRLLFCLWGPRQLPSPPSSS